MHHVAATTSKHLSIELVDIVGLSYNFLAAGAVHMVGGMAALAGAWIAGPRLGRFDANGKPVVMPGHNAVL